MVSPSSAMPAGGPGISRIDQPSRRTYGWFVRVYLPGRTLAKFFPDLAAGGTLPALRRARRHRKEVLAAAEGRADQGLGRRYLTRMDHDRVRGWWARVPDGHGGRVSRLFSDSIWGGADEALTAAGRWRDAVAVHYGLARPPAAKPAPTPRTRARH